MISSQKQLKKLSHTQAGLYEPTSDEMARMKRKMLLIYRDVKRACDARGLTLLLGGGSALGAVRHKGYIPWDDDIDLMLPRADYEVFKREFDLIMPAKYALQAPNAPGREMGNLYMKVLLRGTERREIQKMNAPGEHGLCVDIFPIEYAPDSALLRRAKGFFINALAYFAVSGYMRAYTSPEFKAFTSQSAAARANYRLRMALGFFANLIGYRRLYNLFDRASRGKKKTNWITIPTGIRHYMGEAHRYGAFFPPSEAVFEGERALLPRDAREYLSQLYGDYMTPPPESARERHFYVKLDLGAEGEDE